MEVKENSKKKKQKSYFDKQIEKQQVIWREMGASEEVIEALTRSHKYEYNQGRRHRNHDQSIEASTYRDNGLCSVDDSPLFRYHFKKFSVEIGDGWMSGQYEWLVETEQASLSEATRSLSEDEKKLLNMKFKYDMKQGEIARMLGVTDGTVSKHLAKIINKLRDAMLGGEDM